MNNLEEKCQIHPLHKIYDYLNVIVKFVENYVTSIMLLAMAFIPCIEFICRRFFSKGIPGATDYLQHLTLWVGILGAILAVREHKHLKIVGSLEWLPDPIHKFANIWVPFIASLVCWALCGAGLQLIVSEAPSAPEWVRKIMPGTILRWLEPFGLFSPGNDLSVAGWIPAWIAEVIMPLGFGIMAVCFCLCSEKTKLWQKIIIACSLPVGALLSVIFPMAPAGSVWVGLIILLGSAVLGVPIFVFLGGAALLLFWSDGVTTSAIPAEMYRIVVSPVFPTIPLFTLAGFILSESKASERFVNVFSSLFGWLPGGTAVAITLLCAFFTTFTGASGITILALGGLLLPVLLKSGFNEKFSVGLLTATGSLGLLFPPSLVVILYGVIAKVSIIDMFKAGLLPGILMVLPVCIFCIRQGFLLKDKVERPPFNLKKVLNSVWKAKWELLIPVVALIVIFGGFCTVVEASAITVIYTLIVETVIYRDIKWKGLTSLLVKCSVLVGGVLIVLGVAMGLTSYLVDAQIPAQTAEWTKQHIESPWVFLLILNLVLILAGCMMDIYSALIVVVPLIMPMAQVYGINPIHLGIIFLANLQLGYLTPPVGMNLFLAAFRFEKPLMRVARDALPFLLLMLLIVILITYVPWLSIGIMQLLKSN